jgi:hypothetical protein
LRAAADAWSNAVIAVFRGGSRRRLRQRRRGPPGAGRAAPGGYVVSGRWGFANGVAYADWLLGGFRVPGDDGLPDRLLVALLAVISPRYIFPSVPALFGAPESFQKGEK